MARYLLVAHQTATDPLVIERCREIDELDREAAFTILVPETHVEHRLTCDEVETREAARSRARETRDAFAAAGLRMVREEIGDSNPLQAIKDELRRHPAEHDAVILSTFAPGVSRWLHLDLPRRVEQRYQLPVLHIYPGGEDVWQRTAHVRQELASGKHMDEDARDMREPSGIRRLVSSVPFSVAIVVLVLAHVALMTGLAMTQDLRFLRVEVALVLLMALILLVTGSVGAGHLPRVPWRRMAR
jgi:GABA permease